MTAPAFLSPSPPPFLPSRPRLILTHRRSLPQKPSSSHHQTKTLPQSAHPRHFTVAAISALSLTLCNLSPTPQIAFATNPPPSPPAQILTVSNTNTPSFQLHQPLAVVGVANAPIHSFAPSHQPHQPHHLHAPPFSSLSEDQEEARHEVLLAARLITAVMLGAMLGGERRATKLNLGVRSITLLTISSALCAVMTACTTVTGVSLFPTLAAAPVLFVALAGLVSATGLYMVANSRKKRPHEMGAMCALVGLVVTMGCGCGAGLSLVSAACYLAAVAVLRRRENKGRKAIIFGEDKELRVCSEEGAATGGMALRIGGGGRVVEVVCRVLQDPRFDRGYGEENSQ